MTAERIYFDDLVRAQERVSRAIHAHGHTTATTRLAVRLRAIYAAFCAGCPRDPRLQAEARKLVRQAAALVGPTAAAQRDAYTREMGWPVG